MTRVRFVQSFAVVVALLASTRTASADDPATAAAARNRYLRDQRGLMTVLGGFAIGSIATGALMWTSKDSLTRYAGTQNVVWGAVDGGLAAYSLLSSRSDNGSIAPADHWQEERGKLSTVFLVNAGLDVLYVTAGALLLALGKTDALRGTGAGILAQGGFLLTFDTVGAIVMAH